MKVGMLWFDNSKNTEFRSKVRNAASYYQEKYGSSPTICYVHPSMLKVNGKSKSKYRLTGGIEVKPTNSILPNHFWIGVNGKA